MSDLRPETLEVPDRVRRQIEEMASRLEATESENVALRTSCGHLDSRIGELESALRELVEAEAAWREAKIAGNNRLIADGWRNPPVLEDENRRLQERVNELRSILPPEGESK